MISSNATAATPTKRDRCYFYVRITFCTLNTTGTLFCPLLRCASFIYPLNLCERARAPNRGHEYYEWLNACDVIDSLAESVAEYNL